MSLYYAKVNSAIVSVEDAVENPGREIAEYRYRLNKKRRQVVRSALLQAMRTIDERLSALQATYEPDFDKSKDIDRAEWDEIDNTVKQIEVLLGASLPKPTRWSDLRRHIR